MRRIACAVIIVAAVESAALGCSVDGNETPLAPTGYRARVEAICRDLERDLARVGSGRRAADATRRAYERLATLAPPPSLADEARAFRRALGRAKDDAARLDRAAQAVQAEARRPGRVREKERLLDRWLASGDRLFAAQARLERAARALGFRAVGGCSAERAPDAGQEIVFVRRADLQPEGIYAVDADGGRLRRLLPAGIAPEALLDPAWSPDGKRLAFVASTLGGDAVWVARANGGAARVVWSGEHAESPTWSPDGQQLAFDGDDGLTILDLATGHTRVLVTTDPPQSIDVDWSPDGRLLAVGEFAGIALIRPDEPQLPVDALDARTITGIADRDDVDPAWSPDGRWIAFSRFYYFRRDLPTIHVIRPDGTGLRRVTDGTAAAREPTWSPDGRRIAFTRYPPPSGNELEQDAGEIYVINIDGRGLRRLTHNRVEDFAPHWR